MEKKPKNSTALDELFQRIEEYRDGPRIRELFNFIKRFPSYAPFNAMLLHIQKPGSVYVASLEQWKGLNRRIKPGARPLVILWPFAPVEFVYELGETEGDGPLPDEVLNPFRTQGMLAQSRYDLLIRNLARLGISFHESDQGTSSAGSIRIAEEMKTIAVGRQKVPVHYNLVVNGNHPIESKFATIAHELGHLLCGHLGHPGHGFWPERTKLAHEVEEFEAESAAWMVCSRIGIENPSEKYLFGYLDEHGKAPAFSLEAVLTAANRIEEMTRAPIKMKKKMLEIS